MNYTFEYNSPVGLLTIASDGASITGLWIKGQKYFADTLEPENSVAETSAMDLPVFERVKEWLTAYFSGKNPAFTPPLAPKGSPFRQAVWKILCAIPYGEVITYGDVARMIAKQSGKEKMSAQAVGGAVGHNPISIIIPCHRVVGAHGSLTGYAGGIKAKTELLTLEQADMSKLYAPRKGTAL
ncbi:MAG: methylated-DNA--[protein]-cysteine S-methyltransferase [Treponema sp.]|nr:methylated-DNA--[protein]-cysteine S-methyltransferase [Treponema sp.]